MIFVFSLNKKILIFSSVCLIRKANLAGDFLKTRNPSEESQFLMVLAPPAPHAPFTPAQRHKDAFSGTKAMITPNFNLPKQKVYELFVSSIFILQSYQVIITTTDTVSLFQDKHFFVGLGPAPLPDHILPKLDDIYRNRWEALLAVDDLVTSVHSVLEQRNLLNDTYLIFTSDNGYHIGKI